VTEGFFNRGKLNFKKENLTGVRLDRREQLNGSGELPDLS